MDPVKHTDNQIAAQDWQTTLSSFALAYGFLSKAFYQPPDVDFVTTLFDDDLFSDWPIGTDVDPAQTGIDLLKAFGEQWTADQHRALLDDYNALFVGPNKLLAYPWESVYLSKDGILFDAPTLAVRDFYRRFGLQAPQKTHEPDDHIGLEMAFMVHLCSVGLCMAEQDDQDVLEQIRNAQRDFLSEHLLRWAPAFFQAVIDNTKTDYYRGVAYLGLSTLKAAAQSLDLSMD